MNLRLLKSELATAWEDVSHALRCFYELADRCLKVSNLARQLKFNPEVGNDRPVITHLTASLWFHLTASMESTITSSTSKTRGPNNERKNVAAAEKQVETMAYRLTQGKRRWLILTPRLENVTDNTKESAPPLVKQMWEFLEEQLKAAEKREMTKRRFVTAANEEPIEGFWRDHAKDELKTRKSHEILRFLSPYWEKSTWTKFSMRGTRSSRRSCSFF